MSLSIRVASPGQSELLSTLASAGSARFQTRYPHAALPRSKWLGRISWAVELVERAEPWPDELGSGRLTVTDPEPPAADGARPLTAVRREAIRARIGLIARALGRRIEVVFEEGVGAWLHPDGRIEPYERRAEARAARLAHAEREQRQAERRASRRAEAELALARARPALEALFEGPVPARLLAPEAGR